ncbi:MAG: CRTAC1 family protein [Phycisphaerales bacterium]|nr:CRTAC1 family protein [Phycisphaerales bacterium]|tara:strand:+ start:5362 stop:7077 length:1716 start_codon:yes stop_codon:yes gene_type:complete
MNSSVHHVIAFTLVILTLVSCRPAQEEQPPRVRFVDVTQNSGIDFTTTSGANPSSQILEVNGGGIALFDYDNDGDPDLFIANGATLDSPDAGPGCRLFRNDGESGTIRFTDVTDIAGIDLNRWAMGTATGDIDGDGYIDVHVTCWGQNAMLRNRGDGTFEDITTIAGIDDDAWSTSSVFGDVDADGDLDLYVVNYLEFDPSTPPPPTRYKEQDVLSGPQGLVPQADRLWINDGRGRFDDAAPLGLIEETASAYGLNAIILDFDDDGRQDIVVGNDSMANNLFVHAEREGETLSLIDAGRASGLSANMDGSEQATMGMAVGDLDTDGRPDLFTTNFSADTNTLHRSLANGGWQDRTRQYGLGMPSRPWLGWTTAFVDIDYDGLEDLIILNGHVYPNATIETMDSRYEQPPQILLRRGDRFNSLPADQADNWLGIPRRDRAGAMGDLDGDGDLDLVTAELNGPIRVIQNQTPSPPNRRAVMIHLEDDRIQTSNRNGLGSRLRLKSDPPITRWIHSGGAFQSAHDSAASFNLAADETDAVLEITWPDGDITIHEIDPTERMIIKHSRGTSVNPN